MLVMRFADLQWPAPLSLHSMLEAHYKCQVIFIIIIIIIIIIISVDWKSSGRRLPGDWKVIVWFTFESF